MKTHQRQPHWPHDCAKCRHLNTAQVDGEPVDFYHCPGELGGSLLARFGADAPDYWSAPVGMLGQMAEMGSHYGTPALAMWERYVKGETQ